MMNFAIMIISHKRANTQLTYETLQRVGYTGNLFIIVDDEDPQLEDYKRIYGDIIKVFSKDEMLKIADTIDNFNNKSNTLLPTIYCKVLAEQLNLDNKFEEIVKQEDRTVKANEELAEILGLDNLNRIDISLC